MFKIPLLIEGCDDSSHSLVLSLVNSEMIWSLRSSVGSSLTACAEVRPFKGHESTAGAVAFAQLDLICRAEAREVATSGTTAGRWLGRLPC